MSTKGWNVRFFSRRIRPMKCSVMSDTKMMPKALRRAVTSSMTAAISISLKLTWICGSSSRCRNSTNALAQKG